MHPILRYLFIIILVASSYHLVRDILQTVGINNALINILHRPHLWCNPYCNYATYPLDILGIIGSFIVLKRNGIGFIGIIVLVSLPLWLLVALLP